MKPVLLQIALLLVLSLALSPTASPGQAVPDPTTPVNLVDPTAPAPFLAPSGDPTAGNGEVDPAGAGATLSGRHAGPSGSNPYAAAVRQTAARYRKANEWMMRVYWANPQDVAGLIAAIQEAGAAARAYGLAVARYRKWESQHAGFDGRVVAMPELMRATGTATPAEASVPSSDDLALAGQASTHHQIAPLETGIVGARIELARQNLQDHFPANAALAPCAPTQPAPMQPAPGACSSDSASWVYPLPMVATTGPDGSFRFKGLEAGKLYTYTVTAAGYSPVSGTITVGRGSRQITIRMARELSGNQFVRGRVVAAPFAVPLAVPLAAAPASAPTSPTAANATGASLVGTGCMIPDPSLPVTGATVTIERQYEDDQVRPLSTAAAGSTVTPAPSTGSSAPTGLVPTSAARNAAASGATPGYIPPELRDGPAFTAIRTGSDGRFSFDQLEPGFYRITVSAPGFITWSTVVSPGPDEITVSLSPGANYYDPRPANQAAVAPAPAATGSPAGRPLEVRANGTLDNPLQ